MIGLRSEPAAQPAPISPSVDEGSLVEALLGLGLPEQDVQGFGGFSPEAGVTDSATGRVSRADAIAFAAVNRCVTLIAGSLSTLPIDVRERMPGKRPGPVLDEHPLYDFLHRDALADSAGMRTFTEVLRTLLCDMLITGNGFAHINRTATGEPDTLTVLSPGDMDITARETGSYQYRVTGAGGDQYLMPSEVLHLRMPQLHSRHQISPLFASTAHHNVRLEVVGTSPLVALADQLRMGVLAQRFIINYFISGGFQDYITSPNIIPDTQKKDILRYMAELAKQGKQHMPLVLGNAAEMGRVESSAQGEELAELRHQIAGEVAMVYGVPPFILGLPQTSTWGSGIAELGSAFWRFTLQPIALSVSSELGRKLPRDGGVTLSFNHEQLTRASLLDEMARMSPLLGGNNGPASLTVNEFRQRFGWSPVDGGDELAKPTAYPSGDTSGLSNRSTPGTGEGDDEA